MAFTKAGLWGPDAVLDSAGHPQPGATAAVYLSDGVTLAGLWTSSAKSVALANPTQADIHGNLHFYADPGPYVLKVTVGGTVTALTVEVPIDPGEAAQDQDVTAAIATAEAYADGIVAAGLAGKQPLDSDLTAIAALATTAFGRSFLVLADAAAGQTLLSLGTAATQPSTAFDAAGAAAAAQAASQPLDSDLTAIAALSTTAFGRSLLALVDAAALRTAAGLGSAATHDSADFDAAGTAAAAVLALINGAPGALDTLNELATALADDPNFATTITNALAAKSPILIPTAVKTGNYTAAAGDYVLCDTSGGIFTVTLPTAPADKTSIAVDLVTSGNTLTIARGGADVFQKTGGPTSLSMNTANRVLVLQYQSSIAVWHVQDHLPAVINTKGDLLTYGTERARLPVGANGGILTADSTTATGLKWASKTTLFAADYGTLNTAGSDMGTVFRAVMDAAVAAASTSDAVEVVWPLGTFTISSTDSRATNACAYAWPANVANVVKLRGFSRLGTTFKMSSAAPSLFGWRTGEFGSGNNLDGVNVLQNLTIEDCTVDRNNVVSGNGVFIAWNVLHLSAKNIRWNRIDSIKVGVGNRTTSQVRNIEIVSNQDTIVSDGSKTWVLADIYGDDHNFGRSGGGGNTGVLISVFMSAAAGTVPDSLYVAGNIPSGVAGGKIKVLRGKHTSGITSFASFTAPGNAIGTQVSVPGADVEFGFCESYGNADGGWEIDSCDRAWVHDMYTEDAYNAGGYLRPTLDGCENVEQQRIVVERCQHKLNFTAQTGTSRQSQPNSMQVYGDDHGYTAGHVTLRDVSLVGDGPLALAGTGPGLEIFGGFRSLKVDNPLTSLTGWTYTQTSTLTCTAMRANLCIGRGSYVRQNVTHRMQGAFNPGAAVSIAMRPCDEISFADYSVDASGSYADYEVSKGGSATTPVVACLGVNQQSRSNTTDNFATTAKFTAGWRADVGVAGDYTIGSNALSLSANATVEHRLTQLVNENGGGTGIKGTGPISDQCVWCQVNTSGTFQTNLRVGPRLKVDKTGTNSVHCYLFYDGTDTYLNVDTEVAGTLTNVASTKIITGAAPASASYVRAQVQGNTVTVDYFSSVAPTGPVGVGSPTNTVTYTLATTNIPLFGVGSPQGRPGLTFTPQDANANIKSYTCYQLNVASWRFAHGSFRTFAMGTTVSARGVVSNITSPSNYIRFAKEVLFEDFDFTKAANASAVSDFNSFDATALQSQRRRHIKYMTAPAPTSTTVSTATAYTNQLGYTIDAYLSTTGTLSGVTVTKAGASAVSFPTIPTGAIRLEPGDAVTPTGTGTITLFAVPSG